MRWKRAKQLRFLRDAPVIRVATVGPRGKPQVTPVCHVEWRGKIYWASDPGTAKLENLARHRSLALVADEYRASWTNMGGVMAQGTAKLVRGGPLFRAVRDRLYRKFAVYKSNAPFEEGESVIIEVTPKHLVNWWYK
jgi:nitroimidazol reductase NimA-like FMN-containing flavoprotein (pyridoxamine 5'-phosphate oxidase superfamily)